MTITNGRVDDPRWSDAEYAASFEGGLDLGVARYVRVLREAGIETYESCESGPGHCYPEPTVRFHGDRSEGFRALAAVTQLELPVQALRRIWTVDHAGEPNGPTWEMTFRPLPGDERFPEQRTA